MFDLLTMTAVVQQTGWVLVHSLWQFAIVVLAALALQRVMRPGSAAARYWVLLGAMSAMVVAPAVTWCCLPSSPTRRIVAHVSADHPIHEPLWPAKPVGRHEPAARESPRVTTDSHAAAPAMASATSLDWAARTRAQLRSWRTAAESGLRPWLNTIVGGWAIGVLMFAVRPLLSWHTVRRLRTTGLSPAPPDVDRLLERMIGRLRLRRAVLVMQSTLVNVPVVVGYLRPVVLLPASVLTGLPAAQIEAILAHELAHVRRHDYLVNLLQTLIETVFFYHPAVWWLSRQIRCERENCCDDMAVAAVENRIEYGRALLAVQELKGSGTVLSLGAKSGSLLVRIRRIVGAEPEPRVVSASAVAAASLLAVVLAAGVWAATLAGELQGDIEAADRKVRERSGEETGDWLLAQHPAKPDPAKPAETQPAADKPPETAAGEAPHEQGSDLLREIRRATAPILASMAAEHGYGLAAGKDLLRVAPPFPTIRMNYYRTGHPGQSEAIPTGPASMVFRWSEGRLKNWGMNFAGSIDDGYSLESLLNALLEIKPQRISGPRDLLEQRIAGDWVIRSGVSDERAVKQLETILRSKLSLPVSMEFKEVKRQVYVARGKYRHTPLPGGKSKETLILTDETLTTDRIEIYGKQLVPDSGAGGGTGEFGEFLEWLGNWVGTPIVAEVDAPPESQLSWHLHARSPFTQQMRDEDRDPKLVLTNITAQTGMTFTMEQRPVRILFVERVK